MSDITELLNRIEEGYAKQNPRPSTVTTKRGQAKQEQDNTTEMTKTENLEDLGAQSPPPSPLCD